MYKHVEIPLDPSNCLERTRAIAYFKALTLSCFWYFQ